MTTQLPYLICSILSFVPAIVLHEMAHGFAAWKLGDPTAKRAGRLSFNPLAHVDPFGTVIMPFLLMAMNMPVFGYAKPVPYNPAYFKDPRKGDLIVGLAGPAANLLLAVLAGVVAWVLYGFAPVAQWVVQSQAFFYFYLMFLPMFALINLYLMFFNLLPIPPLDGARALYLIAAFFLGPLAGERIAAVTGLVCSLALVSAGVYVTAETGGGTLFLLASLALLFGAVRRSGLAKNAGRV